MVLLRCNFFSGLHFYTLSKTLIACRDMQTLRFVKVKTLLNKWIVNYVMRPRLKCRSVVISE